MANPLYSQMGRNNLLQQIQRLKSSFNGNPQQIIQQMMQSGRVSQEQYNAAVQKAEEMRKLFGI